MPKQKPVDRQLESAPDTDPRYDLPKYKVVKKLTRDVMSIVRMGEAYIKVQSELYTIPMTDPNPEKKGEPRDVPCVDVLDMNTNEEFLLICHAVMYSTFKRFNGELTGQYFVIKCGEKAPGKLYRKLIIESVLPVE